jgi:hypothetical protein
MSEEMWEDYRAIKQHRMEQKAELRRTGAEALTQHNIPFRECNGGAHLIIQFRDRIVDFWPGTERWSIRSANRWGRGVGGLLKFLGVEE